MKLGINAVLPHRAPEDWAESLHKRGLKASTFPVDYTAPDKMIFAYEKAAEDYNIEIAEVGIWNSPFAPDEKIAKKNRHACLHQLELAETIHARCCVNVSGAAGECWYGCYAENYSKRLYEKNVEFIQNILDTVQPQCTYYALEPMQWMLPDSPEEYLKFMKDVDRERLAVHFDPVNFVNSVERAINYSAYLEYSIRLLKPYIKSCHLKDFQIAQQFTLHIQEKIPGQGCVDLKHYIQQIDEFSPDMPMLLEHLNNWEEYEQGIAYIEKLMK